MNPCLFAAIVSLASSVAIAGQMSVSLPPDNPQITIQGVTPGIRLGLSDGLRDLGVVRTDASGNAQLKIGALSPGPHTITAVAWGAGDPLIQPLHFTIPARPATRLVSIATYNSLPATLLVSGDMHG